MKKIFLILLMLLAFTIADAITLFPHFVDVAGDYQDGVSDKFAELNISTNHWRVSPGFYSDIKEADEFLQDTLPFSSYTIQKETKTLEDGSVLIMYISTLEADGLNKDKWSRLYLFQSPDGPLYVGLAEDKIN